MTVAILQPSYLPWLGYFEQLAKADVFVIYDDVQFDKHGWRNRNRIKAPDGEPHWLTVPVRVKDFPLIKDVLIDNERPWARKQIGTLRQFYAGAEFTKRYLAEFESLLTQKWERILDLNLAVLDWLKQCLQIESPIVLSSTLGIEGGQSDRILKICNHFRASRYMSGDAARDYLDVELFASNGIEVEWQQYAHPEYPQLHGKFVPYLSVLDLLLNIGPNSASFFQTRSKSENRIEQSREIYS